MNKLGEVFLRCSLVFTCLQRKGQISRSINEGKIILGLRKAPEINGSKQNVVRVGT
jgi:hypothetical protein